MIGFFSRSRRSGRGRLAAGVRVLALAFGAGWLWSVAAPAPAMEVVDLELVLAVDSSSSVNDREFRLQMLGIANAFRHPDVVAAVAAGAPEGIAVSLVQWSGVGQHLQAVDWIKAHDPATIDELAARIEKATRLVSGGATAIGAAMSFALDLLRENAFEGRRRIIDVSGDGIANQGERPAFARAQAVAEGVTVNGLAILSEEPNLADYYRDGVVGGPGAFLVTAKTFDDFARAIRRKLIMEISGPPVALRGRPDPRAVPWLAAAGRPADRVRGPGKPAPDHLTSARPLRSSLAEARERE